MDIEAPETLVARSGLHFHVRPMAPQDEPALAAFFSQVTPEDLRFRFLTGLREVGHDRLVAMTGADGDQTESFLALDPGDQTRVIAAAMLAGDAQRDRAEVAITIRSDFKGQGVGWKLLDYLVTHARDRGYASIESVEDRQNRQAISLEREMGFSVEPIEGEATLVLVRRALR